jgi:hypothetical protein
MLLKARSVAVSFLTLPELGMLRCLRSLAYFKLKSSMHDQLSVPFWLFPSVSPPVGFSLSLSLCLCLCLCLSLSAIPPVPLWLVKSPPCSMNWGMMRWKTHPALAARSAAGLRVVACMHAGNSSATVTWAD